MLGVPSGVLDTLLAVVAVLLVLVAAFVVRVWIRDTAGKARLWREEESRRHEAAEQTQRQWWKAEGEARAYQAMTAARQEAQPSPPATRPAKGRSAPAGGRRNRSASTSPRSQKSPAPKAQRPPTGFPQSPKGSRSLDGKLAQLLLVNGYSGNVLTVKSFATPKGLVGFQWEVARDSVAGAEPPRVCGRRGDEVIFVEYAWQGQKADVVRPGTKQYYTFTVTSAQRDDEGREPDLEKDLGFEVVIPATQEHAAVATADDAPAAVERLRAQLNDTTGMNEFVGAFIRSYDEEVRKSDAPAGERNRLVDTLKAKLAGEVPME